MICFWRTASAFLPFTCLVCFFVQIEGPVVIRNYARYIVDENEEITGAWCSKFHPYLFFMCMKFLICLVYASDVCTLFAGCYTGNYEEKCVIVLFIVQISLHINYLLLIGWPLIWSVISDVCTNCRPYRQYHGIIYELCKKPSLLFGRWIAEIHLDFVWFRNSYPLSPLNAGPSLKILLPEAPFNMTRDSRFTI